MRRTLLLAAIFLISVSALGQQTFSSLPDHVRRYVQQVADRANAGDLQAQQELLSIASAFQIDLSEVVPDLHGVEETEKTRRYVSEMQKKANDGDGTAQVFMWILHTLGRGVKTDPAEGLYWLKKAAGSGNSDAQAFLAKTYMDQGEYREALPWLQKSAEAGNVMGEVGLAWLYHDGLGTAPNPQEAMKWSRRAAEAGNPSAMTFVGQLYEEGAGVTKDDATALLWFRKAAELGLARAQYYVGIMYANGRSVEKDYTVAAHWYQLSADQGYAPAAHNLGNMMLGGRGVPKDLSKGLALIEFAANKNYDLSIMLLASFYVTGEHPDISRDPETAKTMLRPLAEQQVPRALLWMARAEDAEHNYAAAAQWLQKAAAKNDPSSVLALAGYYMSGKGVQRDLKQSADLFARAVQLEESPLTLNDAAYFFATVEDSKFRNPELALKYALRAAALSDNKIPNILDTLAEAYFVNGDIGQAIEVETRALAMLPDNLQFKRTLERFKTTHKKQ